MFKKIRDIPERSKRIRTVDIEEAVLNRIQEDTQSSTQDYW